MALRRPGSISMNMCFRIERMCRYSPLDDKEVVDDQAMKDRHIVAGVYEFYRAQGDEPEAAARKARANAVRLIMNEAAE